MQSKTTPFPTGPYAVIYADPPWRYRNDGHKLEGLASSHYRTMSNKEAAGLPVRDIAARNALLFLWATYPKLPDALEVMAAWGFAYKTVAFTWVKMRRHCVPHFGLGYWTRANPEICLLGTRGHPKRVRKDVPNLTMARLRGHSQKPDEVRDKIVQLVGDVPRVELFARERAPGWDAWGEEL
jgi:N6-adenosine-specific RNA methylase IME4